MEIKEILKHVDHTLLLQPSTWEEVMYDLYVRSEEHTAELQSRFGI